MTTREQKRRWHEEHKELGKQRAKQYRLDHPEWAKEMNKKHSKTWRQRFPEKAKALASKQAFKRKLRKYGLSVEQYQYMLNTQQGKCAICGQIPPDGLVIDHNHSTGKVRGLLCNAHNVAVGMVQENLQTAQQLVAYIEKHSTNFPALEESIGNNSPSVSNNSYSGSNFIH